MFNFFKNIFTEFKTYFIIAAIFLITIFSFYVYSNIQASKIEKLELSLLSKDKEIKNLNTINSIQEAELSKQAKTISDLNTTYNNELKTLRVNYDKSIQQKETIQSIQNTGQKKIGGGSIIFLFSYLKELDSNTSF